MSQLTSTKFKQANPFSILVSGATGFIGSKLIHSLSEKGYTVSGMSRRKLDDEDGVKYVKADVFNLEELQSAMDGVEVAFYLLHSMEGDSKHWEEFASREKIQANNFLKAATKAGVKRIIYLGGLVNESLDLSPHMKSRKEVGDILSSGNIPVTQLRASLIIGAQGGSYAMLRYLVERLRIMVCPSWVKSLAQPIAVDDVVDYLIGCLETNETTGKIFDIGGPEKLTYQEMMKQYSAYLNKKLYVIEIPFLTTRLSSYWVDLITPVKASLARPLIDSLVHDTVVRDNSITKLIPLKLKNVRESIDAATREMRENPPKIKLPEQKTSFLVNQKILMCSLILLGIIGTTYYWLDDRSDVYQIGWLAGSTIWYLTIGSAIFFVRQKTRLGYMISGILGWVTFSFWVFDNFHIAFQSSIISDTPNLMMTIRNFVGIGIVSLVIVASHNVFHKVRQYQLKGTPV
jgi:uncharacterized protein YbjT (DUF2867 family)